MFVVGRVLDPQGNRLPGASTLVFARSTSFGGAFGLDRFSPSPIGNGHTDGEGQFRLDIPRLSASRFDNFGAVALAPGYGAEWVDLDPDAEQPAAEIRLRPEQPIQGRLLDEQGNPARGVEVRIALMDRILGRHPDDALEGESLFFGWANSKNMSAWPVPAIT